MQINFISRLIPVTGKDELDKLVFIAQLVEHCSADREVIGSNSVEALKNIFSAKNICSCLSCDYNCDDHISISCEVNLNCGNADEIEM